MEEKVQNKPYVTYIISQKEPKVKLIANNYEDCLFFILTQKDKMGSIIEVQREGEGAEFEIDVVQAAGAGIRSDSYLNLVRVLAEILLKQVDSWTNGKLPPNILRIFKQTLIQKKVVFSVCLEKEFTDDPEITLSGLTQKEIISGFRTFLGSNVEFFIN